jgi:hypothetical protein
MAHTRSSGSFERRRCASSQTSANRSRPARYANDQSKQPSLNDNGKNTEPSQLAAGRDRTSLRTLRGAAEILLVHRPRYDDRTLPEGEGEAG